MSDEICISPHWFSKSEITSYITNIHTRSTPIAPAPPCDTTTSPPENMDITASLDTNQAGGKSPRFVDVPAGSASFQVHLNGRTTFVSFGLYVNKNLPEHYIQHKLGLYASVLCSFNGAA
ncbi:hypothetical protein CHS0354_010093 [Potamilus streckersoni]|uniref:Uncharacterized protein n=1 Tax=Potamilus streckersoni TaxID=2493646 RepID=A0AAE0RRC6_9BIVA|nr:hypothetical protein CHS0354_010093 [Potamilus streckersoni]